MTKSCHEIQAESMKICTKTLKIAFVVLTQLEAHPETQSNNTSHVIKARKYHAFLFALGGSVDSVYFEHLVLQVTMCR